MFISIKNPYLFLYISSLSFLHFFLLLLYLFRRIAIFDSISIIFVSNLWIMNLLSLMYVEIFISSVFSVLPFVDLLSIIIDSVQLQRKINHIKLEFT